MKMDHPQDDHKYLWTKNSLAELVKRRIGDRDFYVVFQDEPYRHTKTSRGIVSNRSVGGVIAALEPIIRTTNGLWIAWGRGDADRLVVDANDRIKLPPDNPQYNLWRIWLSKKEVDEWYYGFANSALWPLAHIAHVRPEFKKTEWETFKKVNLSFARIAAEAATGKDPLFWVHDYQLALVPQYLRERRPDVTIGFFWHIPWPVREIFRICPWRKEILEGLLGADLLGFHIGSYVRAFLASVAHELEAKVDFDANTVEYRGRTTRVGAFPISVDYGGIEDQAISGQDRGRDLIRELVPSPHRVLAFSADRLDYTKGILERLRATDRFLEKYPEYKGQFVFLMVVSPSRTLVPAYQNLRRDVLELAEKINFKYTVDVWWPIHLIERSFSPSDIYSLYRNADLAVVSSLHDGMNLVAKEYVAAAHPKRGRLILSEFAGAAKELTDAFLVNPYDTEQFADTIKTALEIPLKEREARMQSLKTQVRDKNVYRWAGKFLTELTDVKSTPGK